MNERDALLKSVCENPDEDTPRLVFADWLQEHGEEDRAEFIRAQIEVARLSDSPKRKKLSKRADQLLRLHGPRWSFDLPEEEGFQWGREYARGFIESIRVSDEGRFLRCHAECFDSTPIVALSVSCPALDWRALFDAGYLSRVRLIHLSVSDIDSHAEALCAIGPWPNLKRLHANQSFVLGAVGGLVPGSAASHAALQKAFGERVYPLYATDVL